MTNSVPLTDTELQRIMSSIGELVKLGRDPEHFEQLIDELLNTKLNERDRESEAVYQSRLDIKE